MFCTERCSNWWTYLTNGGELETRRAAAMDWLESQDDSLALNRDLNGAWSVYTCEGVVGGFETATDALLELIRREVAEGKVK